jgi:hypothetical protein
MDVGFFSSVLILLVQAAWSSTERGVRSAVHEAGDSHGSIAVCSERDDDRVIKAAASFVSVGMLPASGWMEFIHM